MSQIAVPEGMRVQGRGIELHVVHIVPHSDSVTEIWGT